LTSDSRERPGIEYGLREHHPLIVEHAPRESLRVLPCGLLAAHGDRFEQGTRRCHAIATRVFEIADFINDLASAPERTRTSDQRLRRDAVSCENAEKTSDRDGVVTAIVGALSSAAAKDPQALSRCVEALGLALGALMANANAGRESTG